MPDADNTEIPFLDLANPTFSIRSQAVRDARQQGWYARTPYGLAILRYEEVGVLLRDARLSQGSHRWPEHNQATGLFAEWWVRMVLNRVGDDHARLRRLASPAFSPKLITTLQPQFEAIANEVIDRFAARGHCEFMADFADPYAARVICELLQLSHDHWRELAFITADMGLALGVNYKQQQDRVNAATEKLFDYARHLIADRRRKLGDDFISLLVEANRDKDTLSDQELYDTVVVAVFGGIDTTRNQLGLAMSVFVENPEPWRLLSERPELARFAVEEVMRIRPTTTWVTREAREDITYKGLQITKGTTLHMFAESAGTDPRVFPPGIDITQLRKPPHYGFGAGPHHCLGHFIARGDMTEALKILARRVKAPIFDGEPAWLPDSGNTGPISLPIKFDPEGRA